jgi:Flp pilus assembly protein TadG
MAPAPLQWRSWQETVRGLFGQEDAIAVLEFALIAPIMVYTMLAATDLAAALTVARRLTNATDTIAQLVSQQTNGGLITGTLTDAELATDFNSIITTFPEVLSDAAVQNENWQSDIEPIVSSVTFSQSGGAPCAPPTAGAGNTTCNVTVDWSVGFSNSGFTDTRQCGLNTQTYGGVSTGKAGSDNVGPTTGTIPPTLYSTGTIIVVDLTYVFTPSFTAWITGPFTFERAAYLQPRFFTKLTYSPGPASSPALIHCTFP